MGRPPLGVCYEQLDDHNVEKIVQAQDEVLQDVRAFIEKHDRYNMAMDTDLMELIMKLL